MKIVRIAIITILFFECTFCANAGDYPKVIKAYMGSKPILDGIISPGEYDDAAQFFGTSCWTHECGDSDDKSDLSLKAWIKHDGENLYFAFDVTDNLVYGIDIPRWYPGGDSTIHNFSLESWPWFGDGIELFLNPENRWSSKESTSVKGNGLCWAMQVSTHKSFLYKLEKGGLLPANPRTQKVWNLYQNWIEKRAQQAVVRIKSESEGNGYVIEWKIKADPCLEISKNKYWTPEMGIVSMGINIEIQDLDKKEHGICSFANYRHIDTWAAKQGEKSNVSKWGTLILIPEFKK